MTNEEYIQLHSNDDTSVLALKKAPEGVDRKFCLEQIRSRQKVARKLPRLSTIAGVLFPPSLSAEQCSSEHTALYKQELVTRLFSRQKGKCLIDLTAGFGVDFCFLAPLFSQAIYVEQQEALCRIARHNLPLWGVTNAEVQNADCTEFLQDTPWADLIFMDPARRDEAGRKTVRLADCTPNVPDMLPLLSKRTRYLLLKLSPMLDIHTALHELPHVCEVHVVCVEGECKELLLLLDMEQTVPVTFHCVDIGKKYSHLFMTTRAEATAPTIASTLSDYLYEPNAALLKAGMQDALCARMALEKLHPNSNLFVSPGLVNDFPGRAFRLVACHDFSKQSLKALLSNVKQANLTVRNFPATVEQLRKRLRLKEGGPVYLFATTLSGERHVLLQCEKIQ